MMDEDYKDFVEKMFMIDDAMELHEVFDFSLLRYAPMFRNVKDDTYYTVMQMQSASEEEAMEKGNHVAEFAKGMDGSSEFTGIVVDLLALPLWPGMFVGMDGGTFPVIIIEWDKLH